MKLSRWLVWVALCTCVAIALYLLGVFGNKGETGVNVPFRPGECTVASYDMATHEWSMRVVPCKDMNREFDIPEKPTKENNSL